MLGAYITVSGSFAKVVSFMEIPFLAFIVGYGAFLSLQCLSNINYRLNRYLSFWADRKSFAVY